MTRDRHYEARALLEAALSLALAHDHHAAAFRAYGNLADTLDSSDRFRTPMRSAGAASSWPGWSATGSGRRSC